MNAKLAVPVPILKNIGKIIAASAGMLLLGSSAAWVTHDDTLLILSCVLLAMGSVKAEDLWHKGLKGEYEVVEGIVESIRDYRLHRKYRVWLTAPDGRERTVFLAGEPALKEGGYYRFYLSQAGEDVGDWPFPEGFRPAQSVYGLEEICQDRRLP